MVDAPGAGLFPTAAEALLLGLTGLCSTDALFSDTPLHNMHVSLSATRIGALLDAKTCQSKPIPRQTTCRASTEGDKLPKTFYDHLPACYSSSSAQLRIRVNLNLASI